MLLIEVARQLDHWIVEQNLRADDEGGPRVGTCKIRVLGQTALLEQGCPLTLAATRDVDCYANYPWIVEQRFRGLLEERGKELDPLGHEIWMPAETEYLPVYTGDYVALLLADMDAVLISKALKAAHKNRHLLVEYLASGASARFFQLATQYKIDLEQLL